MRFIASLRFALNDTLLFATLGEFGMKKATLSSYQTLPPIKRNKLSF